MSQTAKALIFLALFSGVVAFVIYWRVGVETKPGDYEVKKANYRLEDGQLEKAEEGFRDALAENPDHSGAHLGLALTFMQMGRNEAALGEFDRAISLEPGLAVAYADRGILHDRMGLYEKALADYRKALELDPGLAKGPGWLWRFLHNVGEKPPTIADRAGYIEKELEKPPEERLLRVPEIDREQRMYKK
ncbi:MAG: hypothetical protein Kow0025_18830 [Thermodesulfovibrionales bacterium]